MKKLISLLLIIVMLIAAQTVCGENEADFVGTWKLEFIEIYGIKFTLPQFSEILEADNLSDLKFFLFLRENGKGGYSVSMNDSSSGDNINTYTGIVYDWKKTDTGIQIGELNMTMVDGMLCFDFTKAIVEDYDDTIDDAIINLCLTKVSDIKADNADQGNAKAQVSNDSLVIKSSPDKYTWYIRNYVGKNCASIGYTSWGGDRMDEYGEGYIKLVMVTPDGAYIDIETDDDLKQYIVTGQSYAPNTELKYVFETDSDGNEYDNLVQRQNIEEIVLCVKKIGTSEETTLGLTEITPSPDKYTWYIRDYSGRNLASCGYTSWAGNRMDEYGEGYIQFVIVSNDGSFIDPEDTEQLKNYVVTGQSYAPNTELKYVFETDSDGNEYDNLVQRQNIEKIEITVKPIGSN